MVRRQRGDILSLEFDLSVAGNEPGHGAEKCCLPRAIWSQDRDEFAFLDAKIDGLQRCDVAVAG